MKVKCRYNGAKYNTKIRSNLTIGKTYEVNAYFESRCAIINDADFEDLYPKHWFIELRKYRIDKINRLLDENDLCL